MHLTAGYTRPSNRCTMTNRINAKDLGCDSLAACHPRYRVRVSRVYTYTYIHAHVWRRFGCRRQFHGAGTFNPCFFYGFFSFSGEKGEGGSKRKARRFRKRLERSNKRIQGNVKRGSFIIDIKVFFLLSRRRFRFFYEG